MSLELPTEVENRVRQNAAQEGISAGEYISRLMQSRPDNFAVSSNDPVARVNALIVKWQKADNTPVAPPAPNDGTMTPSEALFKQWERENAEMTDEEREAEDHVWEGFIDSLNEVRAAQGMRLL